MTICSGSDYFWADAHPFLIVCKPRPVVRVRVRRCVVRIRIGDTRIGVTVVIRPGEDTTVETFRLFAAKLWIIIKSPPSQPIFYPPRFALFRFFASLLFTALAI